MSQKASMDVKPWRHEKRSIMKGRSRVPSDRGTVMSGSAGVEYIRTSGHSIHGGIPCEGAGAEFLVWMEAIVKWRMVKMGNWNQRLSNNRQQRSCRAVAFMKPKADGVGL
ncbi:hypothetical protein C8F04DRAFT_1230010 [Mycena alexandri]|uniref:Uncharacterized protein n=1 Tax=Mycena alexandri TaxID=1745969 RepID=A0AAD6XBJ6_9AGAR|nr:hypothetical protein C8F04DRAFT_1230010 [Mycena alexandri]